MKLKLKDVGIWYYIKPSKGYDGLHIRALQPEVRKKLLNAIKELSYEQNHIEISLKSTFHAKYKEPTRAHWKCVDVSTLRIELKEAQKEAEIHGIDNELSEIFLSASKEFCNEFVKGLSNVERQNEVCLSLKEGKKKKRLSIWWDV